MNRSPRGRVEQEPEWKPDRPKKLVFGKTILCHHCKGKGGTKKKLCGACGGAGVIDE